MLPLARLGVPTQMIETSVEATAAPTSVVALSRPVARMSDTSSRIPSSTIVDLPALIRSTFVVLTSTPTTVWPSFGRHAADTQPTYPSPNTLTERVIKGGPCVWKFLRLPL